MFNQYKCYKSKYKKVGVLAIQIVKSNVSSVDPLSERNRKYILCFNNPVTPCEIFKRQLIFFFYLDQLNQLNLLTCR